MVTDTIKNFEGSKVDSIQRKKIKNESLTDTKEVALSKFNFPIQEPRDKAELASTIKFSAFWLEFSALVADLEALVTEIKALDD